MIFFLKKRLFFIFGLCSVLFGSSVLAQAPAIAPTNIYAAIAKENLKSLTDITLDQKPDVLNALISDEKEFYEVLYEKQKEMLNPHEQTKRRAIFNLLCQKNLISTDVLDEKTWQDLEMLCGPKSDSTFYLASKVDRTYTQMGKALLFAKIVNPPCDSKQFENQQQIIKELVNNTELFDYLNKQLKDLALPENALLSFWEEDTFQAVRHDDGIKMPFLTKKMNSWLNKNAVALEIYDLLDYSQIGTSNLLETASAIALPLYAGSLFLKNHENWQKNLGITKDWLGTGSMAAFFSNFGAFFFLMKIVNTIKHRDLTEPPGKFVDAGGSLLSGMVAGFFAARLPKRLKYMAAMRKCLQERLIYVATYIRRS